MKITLTKPTVYECEGVVLMPGDNEVPLNKAKKLLENKIVQRDVELGTIVLYRDDKPLHLRKSKAKPAKKTDDEIMAELEAEASE
jgi:hypothetical protein